TGPRGRLRGGCGRRSAYQGTGLAGPDLPEGHHGARRDRAADRADRAGRQQRAGAGDHGRRDGLLVADGNHLACALHRRGSVIEPDTPGAGTPGADTPGPDTPGTGTPGADTPGPDSPDPETRGAGIPGADTPGPDTPDAETRGADGTVELLNDAEHPGVWTLLIDGILQSEVDLGNPRHLEIEYMRRLGHLAHLARPAAARLPLLHLRAPALTLAP